MTDPQLKLLLSSMLDELEHVMDDVRERMPESAEREGEWVRKPEYADQFFLKLTEETHEFVRNGEFEALKPLANWLATWRERVDELGAKNESEAG